MHIVHQYDRRKRLLATLGRRYGLVSAPEAPPKTAVPVDTTAAFDQVNGSWLRPSYTPSSALALHASTVG